MCAKWKQRREGFDPTLLVGGLEALRSSSDDDVHFRGDLWFDDVLTVLESAIEFRGPMTEHDRRMTFRALRRLLSSNTNRRTRSPYVKRYPL